MMAKSFGLSPFRFPALLRYGFLSDITLHTHHLTPLGGFLVARHYYGIFVDARVVFLIERIHQALAREPGYAFWLTHPSFPLIVPGAILQAEDWSYRGEGTVPCP